MSTEDRNSLINHFTNLGCTDETKCSIASLVYMDLKRAVKVKNLTSMYDKALDLVYFRGERKDEGAEIIIPTSNAVKIDMLEFEEIQRRLSDGLKRVTIGICDPNSTIIYYSINNDFYEK